MILLNLRFMTKKWTFYDKVAILCCLQFNKKNPEFRSQSHTFMPKSSIEFKKFQLCKSGDFMIFLKSDFAKFEILWQKFAWNNKDVVLQTEWFYKKSDFSTLFYVKTLYYKILKMVICCETVVRLVNLRFFWNLENLLFTTQS